MPGECSDGADNDRDVLYDCADADVEAGPTACNPVTKAPCGEGSRCAWIATGPNTGEAQSVPAG